MESPDITLSFFDNVNNKVVDNLRLTVGKGSKVSIAAACFSIYAFNELKEQLKDIEELRFIFTAPSFVQERESKQRRKSEIQVQHNSAADDGIYLALRKRQKLHLSSC